MTYTRLMDHTLYCCLSREQEAQLREALDHGQGQTVALLQQNLVNDRNGCRCTICGKHYPSKRIYYQGEPIALSRLASIRGKTGKGKKKAVAFFGDHYYAHNKKTLLRFELSEDGMTRQTDEIPVVGYVCHTLVSDDEKYIATETIQGTLSIIDASSKQMIARKTRRSPHGNFAFASDHELIFFFQETIRCWNFIENRETVIWQAPKAWKVAPNPVHVGCIRVICNRRKNSYLFQCCAGQKNYAVFIRNRTFDSAREIPSNSWHNKLMYVQEQEVYTLGVGERILLLDEQCQVREIRACPQMQEISFVGGDFAFLQYTNQWLERVFMSPDGKWFLLGYFQYAILMNREDGRIYGFVDSAGSGILDMGFVDDRRFWYAMGDTTYIQDLPELP